MAQHRSVRRDVGTPIFAGMIAASVIGLFLIPMLYVTFQNVSERIDRWRGIEPPKPKHEAGPKTPDRAEPREKEHVPA